MATIQTRKQGDGRRRFTATVRLRVEGQAYQESRTFGTRAAAVAWAAQREDEIKQGGPGAAAVRRVTVKSLIEAYLAQSGERLGRSKASHLRLLTTFELADQDALRLTAAAVVAHVRARRAAGTGPATVLGDLIWLRVVWRYALLERIGVRMAVLDEATVFCKAEKLVSKANRRVRRVTAAELRALGAWFRGRQGRRANVPPMYDLMWAAIYSCRRLEELCQLRLEDWDREAGTWLVRNVKHPQGAEGHHLVMQVPARLVPVLEVLEKAFQRAPGDDRLVPLRSKSVSSYWTRQLKLVGIADLHWHDLRHEGASRLAEDGLSIPQIQAVSLHESWSSLQRYVHVPPRRAERVEWEGA